MSLQDIYALMGLFAAFFVLLAIGTAVGWGKFYRKIINKK